MKVHSGRLEQVRQRVDKACETASRDPAGVILVAVSKLHPAASVRSLFDQGQRQFGENRLQEALQKQKDLAGLGISWHFIGPVQSNKTRQIAGHFHWVQSVDRAKILDRLGAQRPATLPPLNVCLQVNIDREPQKAGLAPQEVAGLLERAEQIPGLRVRGLMSIPRLSKDEESTRDSHRRMRSLYDQLRAAGHDLDTLSMGMSADLEIAIAEGSTMVRIGTDLFGPRPA